jgi:hypothetical protein
MSTDQKQMQMMVRRELARRPLDGSMVQISVTHGVVYLRGTIRAMRGHDIDVLQEIAILSTVLRQRAGVRDVVSELQTR